MKSFLREVLITAVMAIVIFFAVQSTLQTFVVVGGSMQPTFDDGQRLLVNKMIFNFAPPNRGDVIIFEPPSGQRVDYIKRVIGVPGDTVEVRQGVVYVNGTRLTEPYIKSVPSYSMGPETIPNDNYFVLGDNRGNSNDSHNGWVVPKQNLVGKAWLSIWPPGRWGLAPNYPIAKQLHGSASAVVPAR
jgi:signal peptidase I